MFSSVEGRTGVSHHPLLDLAYRQIRSIRARAEVLCEPRICDRGMVGAVEWVRKASQRGADVMPSFALLDVQGPVIVTYVYQLVEGEVSLDLQSTQDFNIPTNLTLPPSSFIALAFRSRSPASPSAWSPNRWLCSNIRPTCPSARSLFTES